VIEARRTNLWRAFLLQEGGLKGHSSCSNRRLGRGRTVPLPFLTASFASVNCGFVFRDTFASRGANAIAMAVAAAWPDISMTLTISKSTEANEP
jgi:hypothetical protein